MIYPGEIYMADFGPAGPHPVTARVRRPWSFQLTQIPFKEVTYG